MKLDQSVKISFLGDSITHGAGVSSHDKCFVSVVGRKTGAVVQNCGISGTRIARKKTPSVKAEYDQCFLDRVTDLDADTDVVVVFGGTNDFGHGDAAFGSFDDSPESEYTFYGALRSLALRLIRRFPTKKIVWMTPLHRRSEETTVNEIGLPTPPLREYVRAMKEIAAEYSIPVLDLFATAGIQPMIEEQRAAFCPDGLHPNDVGAERLADRVIAFLGTL